MEQTNERVCYHVRTCEIKISYRATNFSVKEQMQNFLVFGKDTGMVMETWMIQYSQFSAVLMKHGLPHFEQKEQRRKKLQRSVVMMAGCGQGSPDHEPGH